MGLRDFSLWFFALLGVSRTLLLRWVLRCAEQLRALDSSAQWGIYSCCTWQHSSESQLVLQSCCFYETGIVLKIKPHCRTLAAARWGRFSVCLCSVGSRPVSAPRVNEQQDATLEAVREVFCFITVVFENVTEVKLSVVGSGSE